MKKLKIDESFQALIYPIDKKSYDALEEDIFDNGCKNPIKIWNDTIIDGHKRYEICLKWELPFTTKSLIFNNATEVICWICKDQLTRTDLPDETRRYLIGKCFDSEKQVYLSSLDTENMLSKTRGYQYKIAGILGNEFNIAAGTVYKYGVYAKAIDNIYSKNASIVQKILSGKLRISQDNIIELSRLPKEEVRALNHSLSESNTERIGYSEMRHELQWQRLPSTPIRKKKSEPVPPIKEIPEYDPDAEISSLTLTIPSWTSSIERTRTTADFLKVSPAAKSKLLQQLSSLINTIHSIQETIKETH